MAQRVTAHYILTPGTVDDFLPSRRAKFVQLNEKFGDYLLLEQVGIGGMAEVYLARRTGMAGFEKNIVIKRIRPHLTEQRAFVNMF